MRSVLLIEDEDAHATLIKQAFAESELKLELHRVSTLKDGIEWITKHRKFVVIADYLLPDGKGLQLANAAKNPVEVGFPLILLTAHGSEKLASEAFKSGAMDYVVKDPDGFQTLPWKTASVFRDWDDIIGRKRDGEELKKAMEIFNAILSKASKGDITAKVDLDQIGEKYKPIGKSINKMIELRRKSISEKVNMIREILDEITG